jgi:transposase
MPTKKDIAKRFTVHERTVDNWRARKLLSAPIKLGSSVQARVRWTDEQVAELARNLAALNTPTAATP